MIFKSFIVEKNISLIDEHLAVLFYGENIGLKDDFRRFIKHHNKNHEQVSLYQNDILKNPNLLTEQVLNTSLFSRKKIIIINDLSEKLKKQVIEITEKPQNDVKIFLFSENLDKKSLIRAHFEKEKNLAVIPCYQDNEKTLSIYLRNKLNGYQGISQDLVNMLIKNSGVDRKVLSQEIEKIKDLFITKKIDYDKVNQLINNAYNIDFDNLRDCCFEGNKIELNKNLGQISIGTEKAYLYLGSLNSRVEKLIDLNKLLAEKNDIDLTIDTAKPRIFWKDKVNFKKQLKIWNSRKLEEAKKIIFQTEIVVKTKLNSLSDVLIKKLLVELCCLAEPTS